MILEFITWTANPDLISVGPLTVRWYGLMFAVGFWLGYEILYRIFRHEGAPEAWLGKLFIYLVIATIVGSRLGHVFFYQWDYYSTHLSEIFKIWEGGLAIFLYKTQRSAVRIVYQALGIKVSMPTRET